MSAAPTYLLFCDEEGCEEVFMTPEALKPSTTPKRLAEVRAQAKEEGWTSRVAEPGAGHKFARTLDSCVLCSRTSRGRK